MHNSRRPGFSTPKALRWGRRDAIKMLALGGAGWALEGCVHTPPSQALPPCVGTGSAPHQVFDTHIHIFNGTDLQVAGFLRESVALEYPSVTALLKVLAQPVQDFVWQFSPTAQDELSHLEAMGGRAQVLHLTGAAAVASALQSDRAATAAQYNEFLREQLNDPNVQRVLSETLRTAAAPRARLSGAATLWSELLNIAPRTPLEARSIAAQIDLALGLNIFEYLGRYFSYRYANFYEVVEQYACHATPAIDTFVTLMVDFDEPLSHRPNPKSPLNQQIPLISKICELSQGRLVALAPFCPFKEIARAGGESFANIQQAWQLPGFVGAKIYPPMGFQAYDNARTTLPQGAAVDAALAKLYRECIKEDAPVLAHAGPSLCVAPGPCDFPGPPGWQAALDYAYQATGKPLRVSLGHFGDPLGDTSESHDWPNKFLCQMEAPSGARLFADLAYANEILDPTKEQAAVDLLRGLLSEHPVAYQRLLYGSDWLMLGLESKWKDYLTRMLTVIDQVESDSGKRGFANRFFGTNARSWLGLDVPTSLASRNGFA